MTPHMTLVGELPQGTDGETQAQRGKYQPQTWGPASPQQNSVLVNGCFPLLPCLPWEAGEGGRTRGTDRGLGIPEPSPGLPEPRALPHLAVITLR